MDKKRAYTFLENVVVPPRRRKPKYPSDDEIAKRAFEGVHDKRFKSYRAAITAYVDNDLDQNVDLESKIRRIKRLINRRSTNKVR
jgi:hypothetical protein